MAKKKTKKVSPLGKTFQFVRIRFKLLSSLLALVGCGYGCFFLYSGYFSQAIIDHEIYQLNSSRISITPPPKWIRSEIKTEVLSSIDLQKDFSLLSDNQALNDKLKSAFEVHPWVRKVTRIERSLPASLHVEMAYRRPLAAVELQTKGTATELFPIDAKFVNLPAADYSVLERQLFPRITGIVGSPPLLGDPWTDPKVQGAVRLVYYLANDWNELKLYKIEVVAPASIYKSFRYNSYDIIAQSGTRIHWGSAPGVVTGEPSFKQKLATLKQYVSTHGALDSNESPQSIDLRQGHATIQVARKQKHLTQQPQAK